MPTVLITGAMGFLGSHCLKKFETEGFEVISTDIHQGADIVGNLSNLKFVKSLPEVDIVVNCAAVQYVTKHKPILRAKFFYENNVISAKNLAERYRSVSHFIHVGTSMMYKISEDDLSELNQFQGNGVYSKSKCDAQRYIDEIPNSATVIPCIIGGAGREGLFKAFVKMIESLPLVIVPGDGTKPIHMVHVEDVAELILLICRKNSFGLFNAASTNPLSINQWIKVIALKLEKPIPKYLHIPVSLLRAISTTTGYRILAREQLLMLERQHVLSIDKSMRLGWVPKYTNSEIAEQIAGHIRDKYA
jgi:nucleoside-diphosphate-sugar epimerase